MRASRPLRATGADLLHDRAATLALVLLGECDPPGFPQVLGRHLANSLRCSHICTLLSETLWLLQMAEALGKGARRKSQVKKRTVTLEVAVGHACRVRWALAKARIAN